MHSNVDTKKISSVVNDKMSLVIRKIALDGLRQLRVQSPVKTGRFKANWSSSIDNMHTDTTEKTAVPFETQVKAIKNYELGQTAFLHNNLEYAVPLEFGHSTQAPKGWVRNTAISMQKKLNEIKDLL